MPVPDQPHVRVHADLFGPMLGRDKKSAYILCITDTFTKYAVVTKDDNKDAETVAKATTGFASLESKLKSIRMEEKNLSTSYLMNFLNCSMCNIQKHCLITLSAMLKWKFLTKLSGNTWLPMWMIAHLTGTNGIIPQLLQHRLSFCLDSNQDCHRFQLRTLNDITMVSPLLQSGSKCCTRLAN